MNVHDSEKISGVLYGEGYCASESLQDADLIIYNTCSIRHKAEQKFFSELGRIKSLKRKNPALRIAVAGCIAQQKGENIFKRAPYVDFVFGPQNIHALSSFVQGEPVTAANLENPAIAETDLPIMRSSEGRAWVTIMYGCDNFCTYCIVPFTRGREKSRPSENILREIKELGQNGFKEVTLLGQNVNSYRSDTDFPGLLGKINPIDGIERVRFVTSNPKDLSEYLISAMNKLDKVCEHIHLPLQSGSDRVLKLMKRGYTYEDYLYKIESLRKKISAISITTDIITGFPEETDEDHALTIKALRGIEFDGIFAFKYSARPGTKAALIQDLDGEIKSERLSEILNIQDAITLKINKKLYGTVQEVLVEVNSDTDKSIMTGRTRSNKIVKFSGKDCLPGSLVSVRITDASKHSLKGIVL